MSRLASPRPSPLAARVRAAAALARSIASAARSVLLAGGEGMALARCAEPSAVATLPERGAPGGAPGRPFAAGALHGTAVRPVPAAASAAGGA